MGTIERHEVGTQFPVDAEHLHRYAFAQELVKDKVVLDIACGEGYGSHLLSENAASVIGMDVDLESISQATKKYTRHNLTYQIGNLIKIPAHDNSFDVVISFETLEHITEHEEAMAEIKRVLKHDGILLLSTPNKAEYSDKPSYSNPFHLKELYRANLANLIGKFFTKVKWFSQRFYHASLIASEQLDVNSALPIYCGSANNLSTKWPREEPVYFVIIASNTRIPNIDSSLFDISASIIQNHRNEIAALYDSRSYRIGNFFVRAAKLFSKM